MSTTSRAKRTAKQAAALVPPVVGLEGEFIPGSEPLVMPKSIKAWRAELDQALADDLTSAQKLLDVVKQARAEGYDFETVKENVFDAFKCAGCTDESARARANDAVVIVNYPEKAFDAARGGSVQVFAASVRKMAKELGLVQGRKRGPKVPKDDGQEGAQDAPGDVIDENRTQVADDQGIAALATTRRALEQLANRAGGNLLALDIIANIRDLLDDVADAMIGVEMTDQGEQTQAA